MLIAWDELVRMKAHAEAGYPHEVVGVLAGSRHEGRVLSVVALVNERADSAHNRYVVGPLALMKAEEAIEARGLEVVGYYHSHPDHPAGFSDFDREHALPNMSYTIVSVLGGNAADVRSFRLREDRSTMDEEPIEIG